MQTSAMLRGVRLSPQKGRLVADQVRGLQRVEQDVVVRTVVVEDAGVRTTTRGDDDIGDGVLSGESRDRERGREKSSREDLHLGGWG